MEKEKKQIKISLWTFYVLIAGIVILIGAVIIGGMNIKKKMDSLEQGNLASQIETEKNNGKVDNTDKAEIAGKNDTTEKEENLKDVTLDDKDVQKCLAYLGIKFRQDENVITSNSNMLGSLYYEAKNNMNKLTKNNISNDLILSLATNYAYNMLEANDYESLYEKETFTKDEMKNNIYAIFGKSIKYKDSDFNNGMQLEGGFPWFKKARYVSNEYNVEGRAYESGPLDWELISLFKDTEKIKKDSNNIVITMPIAFRVTSGEMDYFLTNYYSDLNLSNTKNYENANIVKNLIAHNYYSSGYLEEEDPQEFARLKQELAVNDGLGTIEENMDKLHKIKMTFTKDDSNEYHFESFEIID